MLHRFQSPIDGIALPQKFTYPFCYTPHPLCALAAREVRRYLRKQTHLQTVYDEGKMFGVLVVKTTEGAVGYIAAFSGLLASQNLHPFFVPPVYDLLSPDGFFKPEEQAITDINHRIATLEESEEYRRACQRLNDRRAGAERRLARMKEEMRAAKQQRDEYRKLVLDEANQEVLIRQSQFMKAEYKRQERAMKQRIDEAQAVVDSFETEIQQLKSERKQRSAALQQRLFEQFRFLNARGEVKDLCDIFRTTRQGIPPAGAGECAAPKLLQYAYQQGWQPLAMAEFWWGASPQTTIRRHGRYYPACKGKCEPILKHMLAGLDVEENPLQLGKRRASEQEIEIIYEDPWLLVVNKPAGLLTIPDEDHNFSLFDLMAQRYPDIKAPLIVHRLDMATSGILIITKDKEAHKGLQQQFTARTVEKRYIALLDGLIAHDRGTISLPLCPDLSDRPRQMVSEEYGKESITDYEVLERVDGKTRVAFYPRTGRTHQLRVHAAHPQGLNCPIVGDELYGAKADRLHLHAQSITFTHPITGQRMTFSC